MAISITAFDVSRLSRVPVAPASPGDSSPHGDDPRHPPGTGTGTRGPGTAWWMGEKPINNGGFVMVSPRKPIKNGGFIMVSLRKMVVL